MPYSGIREIKKKDYRHITKIHRACFPHDNWGVRTVADIMSYNSCFGLLIEEKGKIASFIICRNMVFEGEILSFGVHPDMQGKGFGKKILGAGIEEMAKRNARVVFLEVAEDNEYATTFYLKAGFEKCGQRKKYYERKEGRIDAVIMKYKI